MALKVLLQYQVSNQRVGQSFIVPLIRAPLDIKTKKGSEFSYSQALPIMDVGMAVFIGDSDAYCYIFLLKKPKCFTRFQAQFDL